MTRSLDRFAQGLDDPQEDEDEVAGYCEGCGAALYVGDPVYIVDGAVLHRDEDCLAKYVGAEENVLREEM